MAKKFEIELEGIDFLEFDNLTEEQLTLLMQKIAQSKDFFLSVDSITGTLIMLPHKGSFYMSLFQLKQILKDINVNDSIINEVVVKVTSVAGADFSKTNDIDEMYAIVENIGSNFNTNDDEPETAAGEDGGDTVRQIVPDRVESEPEAEIAEEEVKEKDETVVEEAEVETPEAIEKVFTAPVASDISNDANENDLTGGTDLSYKGVLTASDAENDALTFTRNTDVNTHLIITSANSNLVQEIIDLDTTFTLLLAKINSVAGLNALIKSSVTDAELISLNNFKNDDFTGKLSSLGLILNLASTQTILKDILEDQIDGFNKLAKGLALKISGISEINDLALSTLTDSEVNSIKTANEDEALAISNKVFTAVSEADMTVSYDGATGVTFDVKNASLLEERGTLKIDVLDNGEYTVTSSLFDKLGSTDKASISFDYLANDGIDNSNSATATLNVQGTTDLGTITGFGTDATTLTFANENSDLIVDIAAILKNANSEATHKDIETIDISEGDHILSNLKIEDFIAMTDSDNKLIIDGNASDEVKIDIGDTWTKETSSDATYDTYTATYTKTGSADVALELLIDKDITVTDI